MLYNYESESRRLIFYISLVIWISALAIIKFYKPSADVFYFYLFFQKKIAVPLLCIFTMFYSIFVSCTLSGGHHKTESANVLYIFGLIWFIITILNFLNFVGLLICSALSKEVTFKSIF